MNEHKEEMGGYAYDPRDYTLENLLIIKKDDTLQEYRPEKIVAAINKSAERCDQPLTDYESNYIVALVERKMLEYMNHNSTNTIPVKRVHAMVENALSAVREDVSESYRNYRNWKLQTDAAMTAAVWEECQIIDNIGDKSNSNADSLLVSTKRVKKLDALETAQYKHYILTRKELQAANDGYIYPHDKGARQDTFNCCLFDAANVLSKPFEMNGVYYTTPKSLDVAFDVLGDVIMMAASQQYGGFTVPEVDKIMSPFAQKTYDRSMEKYRTMGVSEETAARTAEQDVAEEMRQGFQGWEVKFNTVASSRGDYPFITITLGLAKDKWGKLAATTALSVRMIGQGLPGKKKPVLFPKIVFLYDETLHGPGGELEDVFEAGVACSAKAMYPDWLSLTGEGYVPSMYKKYGKVISPMGCRAFLSPYYERGGMYPADDEDQPFFVGRFNIGVVSLHLPMILAKARKEDRDFYEVLDYYLEMIRRIHLRTYDYLGQLRASCNPLAFCYGGFHGGNLKFEDRIAPLLKYATASFGITALNELQQLYNKKSIYEDGAFALEVMQHIQDKVNEFKKEDGRLYAIYGTPAESLCGLQVKQFRKLYGIVENVSDREYVSNSFHCHVTEKITPVQKQDAEKRFWDLFNGGKIQYVRYPLSYNKGAIRTLVRRAMKMGFYEGVNLSLSYCDDCGHEQLEMDTCPVCGSTNVTKIDRMNGYLSYSRVHGDTRLNSAKMAEIKDRVSM